MSDKQNIYGLTRPALCDWCRTQGLNPAKARLIFRDLYRERISCWQDCALGERAREKLAAQFDLRLPEIRHWQTGEKADKFLLVLTDGETVECVVMKHGFGWSLCLSSQVGCAMGCAFCASGRGGKRRDLCAAELVGQYLAVQQAISSRYAGQSLKRVAVMGMGEPLDNLANLQAFLDIMTDEQGLDVGPRHLTVSTCGLPAGIRALARRPRPHDLCLSLHAPNDELRARLMPVARRYPLSDVLAACRDYCATTRQRIVMEYALLAGVNDSEAQAAELIELLSSLPCSVNLIPYNPTGAAFAPSPPEVVRRFYARLKEAGMSVTLRKEMGAAENAACGQLRARWLEQEEDEKGSGLEQHGHGPQK